MTAEAPPLQGLKPRRPFPARLGPKGNLVYKLVTTTDHKLIGIMYMVACFIFFFIGGLMALFISHRAGRPRSRWRHVAAVVSSTAVRAHRPATRRRPSVGGEGSMEAGRH